MIQYSVYCHSSLGQCAAIDELDLPFQITKKLFSNQVIVILNSKAISGNFVVQVFGAIN